MKELTEITFVTRLVKHPQLKARFEAILDMVENTKGDLIRADEVEQRAIEQVRQLGKEVLQNWAKQRVTISAKAFKEKEPQVAGNGQKK